MQLTHHTPDGVRRSRHQSLSLYGLPDPATPEAVVEALTGICRLARSFTGVDGAAVVLLPDGAQVTLASTDATMPVVIPERDSVCAALLEQRPVGAIVIPDLSRDVRFDDNPYVTSKGVRGYASSPLVGHERIALGTLCVWSSTARTLTRDEALLLDQLALAAVKVLDDARRDRPVLHRFPPRRLAAPTLPAA
ncbi:GAF domain-containing protein [Jatrophihabitans sp. YIM 134969]